MAKIDAPKYPNGVYPELSPNPHDEGLKLVNKGQETPTDERTAPKEKPQVFNGDVVIKGRLKVKKGQGDSNVENLFAEDEIELGSGGDFGSNAKEKIARVKPKLYKHSFTSEDGINWVVVTSRQEKYGSTKGIDETLYPDYLNIVYAGYKNQWNGKIFADVNTKKVGFLSYFDDELHFYNDDTVIDTTEPYTVEPFEFN